MKREAVPAYGPGAIHFIPPDCRTPRRLRELVGLDDLRTQWPDHELFVVAMLKDPAEPFAVVMAVRKDVVHIQDHPVAGLIDWATRVVVVYPPNQVPIGDGRVA